MLITEFADIVVPGLMIISIMLVGLFFVFVKSGSFVD